jgi:hypothetical protein
MDDWRKFGQATKILIVSSTDDTDKTAKIERLTAQPKIIGDIRVIRG